MRTNLCYVRFSFYYYFWFKISSSPKNFGTLKFLRKSHFETFRSYLEHESASCQYFWSFFWTIQISPTFFENFFFLGNSLQIAFYVQPPLRAGALRCTVRTNRSSRLYWFCLKDGAKKSKLNLILVDYRFVCPRTRRGRCGKLRRVLSACFWCKRIRQLRGPILPWCTFAGPRWRWSKIWLGPQKSRKEIGRNLRNISRCRCCRNRPPCECEGASRNAASSRRVRFGWFWACLWGCCSRLFLGHWWRSRNRKEKSGSSWSRSDRTSLPSLSTAPRLLLFCNKTSRRRRRWIDLLLLSDICGWCNLDSWGLFLRRSKHLPPDTPKSKHRIEGRSVFLRPLTSYGRF